MGLHPANGTVALQKIFRSCPGSLCAHALCMCVCVCLCVWVCVVACVLCTERVARSRREKDIESERAKERERERERASKNTYSSNLRWPKNSICCHYSQTHQTIFTLPHFSVFQKIVFCIGIISVLPTSKIVPDSDVPHSVPHFVHHFLPHFLPHYLRRPKPSHHCVSPNRD